MTGGMIGFIIWLLVGFLFLGYGIYILFSKKEKAVGFWANAKMFPVKDVKLYNQAVAKLWIAFSIIFMMLGMPLLSGQNSPLIFLSICGLMIEVIIVMVIYTMVIEKKYKDISH